MITIQNHALAYDQYTLIFHIITHWNFYLLTIPCCGEDIVKVIELSFDLVVGLLTVQNDIVSSIITQILTSCEAMEGV